MNKQPPKNEMLKGNFGLQLLISIPVIAKRKRNHASLVNNLIHPKPFTSKQTEHGESYEPVALKEYGNYVCN